MNHFPKLLSPQIGFDVAETLLEGFDRHYRVFRETAIKAKGPFEAGDRQALQRLAREHITSYDDRVEECVTLLEDEYDAKRIDNALWQTHKDQILADELADFFPYERSARFSVRHPERFAPDTPAAVAATPAARAA
jgi:isocitrate dehydrogenase kinase/phosphatase